MPVAPHPAAEAILGTPVPIVSVKPVDLEAPTDRGTPLQVRVSAPVSGERLPVVVFAHGNGSSFDGYAPLTDVWASHGFVVVQPTFLDSRALAISHEDPRFPGIWRSRVVDLRSVIDQLDTIEASLPGLAGRVDRDRIAVAGHSWGAHSAGMLLGIRLLGADGRPGEDFTDPRVRAGVLLALTGEGGDHLAPFAQGLPFLSPSFADFTAPALVVAGDHDQSQLSSRGPEWFTEGYHLAPAPKALLTLHGGEHSLGGVPGYESAETTDESPARVALIQLLTTAYLRTQLGLDPTAWPAARQALTDAPQLLGTLEWK